MTTWNLAKYCYTWKAVLRSYKPALKYHQAARFPVCLDTKQYLLLWPHWSQYRVKFRNSDSELSAYSQLYNVGSESEE